MATIPPSSVHTHRVSNMQLIIIKTTIQFQNKHKTCENKQLQQTNNKNKKLTHINKNKKNNKYPSKHPKSKAQPSIIIIYPIPEAVFDESQDLPILLNNIERNIKLSPLYKALSID